MNSNSTRVAIVTGGAGDTGKTITFKLIEEGYHVYIIDNNKSKLSDIKNYADLNSLNLLCIEANVTCYETAVKTIKDILTQASFISALINVAGITRDASIIHQDCADFDEVMQVNLKGTYNYIKAIAPVFKAQKYGKIVNISSINAIRGKHGQAAYTASKGAINSLTKTAAIELGKYNININAIAPGMIKTSMIQNLPKAIIQKALEETLLKRLGEPQDIAELVAFLVSEKARHITGQIIQVDGGQYT
jgi:3-oxoacyl-[acyl-carrier protein] reductase